MSHSRDNLDRLFAQLLEGDLSPAEREQLQEQLRADASLRKLYRKYMTLDALLRWEIAPPLMKMGEEGSGARGQGSEDSPLAIPTLPTTHYPLPTTFVGGPVFSYMVATVVLCLMLFGAWAYKISHDYAPFIVDSRNSKTSGPSDHIYVGHITGATDCRWSNEDTQTLVGASVPLDRRYELASGLLEITYRSGAKVILEGPCIYKVDTDAGGFLTRGKLTAKVEAKGSGFRVQGSEHSPPSTLHSPLFAVRTPAAVVTDLGTEFGVEVMENGQTMTEVFVGSVRLEAIGAIHTGRTLLAKQSGVVRAGQTAVVVSDAGESSRFVRSLPTVEDAAESDAYAKLVLSLSPAAYYRMERPKAAQDMLTVVDSTSGERHGKIHGSGRESDLARLWCGGRFGGGLRFRGEFFGDHVVAPRTSDSQSNQITCSAWVLVENNKYRWPHIITEGGSRTQVRFKMLLNEYDGDLAGRVSARDGQYRELRQGGSAPLPLGQWQHVVLVADGSEFRLYRNGEQVAATPCDGVMATPPGQQLLIGCANMANDPNDLRPELFWQGLIDEVAIFHRALSSDEIKRLYEGPADRPAKTTKERRNAD